MITISACLIVKNEEKVLARCLDSIKSIVDEIIVVDTGSTDHTKEIAQRYTDKIYDFTWVNDFSKARNFSFSKTNMDYIYVADADEVIDEENIQRFLQLKRSLSEEIEIVQMYYGNQLEYNTTYNFDKEYRPKLYKRIRTFTWMDQIHESVRLEPVIYNSEITILHKPLCSHADRDFATFIRVIESGQELSFKMIQMYARELYIAGSDQDFIDAYQYFQDIVEHNQLEEELLKQCQCVIARAARVCNDDAMFFKTCLKNIAVEKSSAEVCCELGQYYLTLQDPKEASIWFYNAAYETDAELNIHYSGDIPLIGLSRCYDMLGNKEESESYRKLADSWKRKMGDEIK
ncbi:MAG: glycosyltransferase family 2 protein [Clostridiales bacterium]|nr:glycosyltransferase family 2 protein [Clostridiales bacterium]